MHNAVPTYQRSHLTPPPCTALGAPNLNIHLHCLVLAGVCQDSEGGPVFHAVPAPTGEQLQALLGKIITRIMRVLTRHGALIEEQGVTYLADFDAPSALTPLQAASCTYRIALGPRAGQKVLSLPTVAPRTEHAAAALCANAHSFSRHAALRCGADERKELEHLCRYITRPALAKERLTRNAAGQVVLKLKSAYRDGTTHLVMSPLEFMQRLAALVPRPRLHRIRFHGVLAAHAKLRSEIVPSPAEQAADHAHAHGAAARMRWARLLKRVFAIDVERCPQCGGRLKIIAAIEEPALIAMILTHLGLPARAPPRAPARRVDLFQVA